METTDLKATWKSSVKEGISPLAEQELNEFVIAAVQRSLKPIQFGGLFQWIVLAVLLFIVVRLLFMDGGVGMKLLDGGAFLILFVSSFCWKCSDRKMSHYTGDIPVKAWLEQRIAKLKKWSHPKYTALGFVLAFVFGFGFHVVHQLVLKAPFNPLLSGVTLLILFAVIGMVLPLYNKKRNRTLRELETICGQMEEEGCPDL